MTRKKLIGVVAVVLLIAGLSWPASSPAIADAPAGAQPFAWSRDSLWNALEATFASSRVDGCAHEKAARAGADSVDAVLARLRVERVVASAPLLDTLEERFFRLAPRAAACRALAIDYVGLQSRLREAMKWQSTAWDLKDRKVRDRLYQSLYGGRAAVEEVMLQQDRVPMLFVGSPVASATPSAMSNGVELHSGDMLVSRGGYPTSALIARGSDYPGNFSHVALVHVDSARREISVIEAHIERGVSVGTADQYLADKKLRVMLLRPRPDLPELQRDPMLPHRAATTMLQRARTEHVPYDFTMDYADPASLFCSEVASAAYREHGIVLWTGISTITAPGLRRWLASFGVRQFETQEPSDLEYDSQLAVVAEWRDGASLFDDHMDNAVTDVMLQGAERGEELGYDWYKLPVARVLKGYSLVREQLGGTGTIPEGMSPAAALRNQSYKARHTELKAELRAAAERWTAEKGYRPPYWVLVSLATEATRRSSSDQGSSAALVTPAAAVMGFYTAYATPRFSGLPNGGDWNRMSSSISASLARLIVAAQAEQARCMKANPGDKPPWIEGDMFSSNFEGFTRFTLADSGATSGSSSTITVDFEYRADGQRTAWRDQVLVVRENGRWLIDDVRYLQNSAFGNGFGASLRGSLKPGGGC